jgi:hypothetical protein
MVVEDAAGPELLVVAGAAVVVVTEAAVLVVEVGIAVVVLAGCAAAVVVVVPDPQPTAPMTSAVTATQTRMPASKRLFMEHPISSRGREVREKTLTFAA